MKNENFSKFVLFLNQKTICTFCTRIKAVFNKKFEIQITLTLKNKFPSENT